MDAEGRFAANLLRYLGETPKIAEKQEKFFS